MGFLGCSLSIIGKLLAPKSSLQSRIFFQHGRLLKKLNHTLITLIPKMNGACNFNQFRPISLCNFVYKIISKILVNRLRPLLAKIIDPAQSAFVPKRWITENVVIAQEIVHSFKNTKKKKGFVGFKLDFHKAYDSLEWNFIMAVLKALGFNQYSSQLIHQCISTVTYTLLLNGTKSLSFSPSRGIRQGDPLSPYLFILCSEVLARLINREESRGSISGVKVAVGAPSISKLLYADDVLLFCEAKISEVNSLMKCVELYSQWSGLTLSIDKSGLFVSKGVHTQFSRQVKRTWGFKQLSKNVKYLGMPFFFFIFKQIKRFILC